MGTKSTKLYYGYRVVFCAFLCLFFGQILYTNSAGIYTKAITEEFGFTRSAFTFYMTVSATTMMLISPFMGKLLQSRHVKKVMVITQIIMACSYIGFTFCTQLWQFYCLGVGLGIGFAAVIRLAPSVLVNFWFGPKLKPRVMTVVTMGSAIGAVAIVPLIAKIVSNYGWRYGYYTAAAILLLFVTPCFFFIVSTPELKGLKRAGDLEPGELQTKNAEPEGYMLQQVLRRPAFALMAIAMIFLAVSATGLLTNVQIFFTDIGFDPVKAAWIASTASGLQLFGKLADGYVIDKFGIKQATVFCIATYIGSMLCLCATTSSNSVIYYGFIVLFALGASIPTLLGPLITSYLWGTKDYGANYGAVNLASSVGTAIGPTVTALMYDISGTYRYAWLMVACALGIAGICFFSAMILEEKKRTVSK